MEFGHNLKTNEMYEQNFHSMMLTSVSLQGEW